MIIKSLKNIYIKNENGLDCVNHQFKTVELPNTTFIFTDPVIEGVYPNGTEDEKFKGGNDVSELIFQTQPNTFFDNIPIKADGSLIKQPFGWFTLTESGLMCSCYRLNTEINTDEDYLAIIFDSEDEIAEYGYAPTMSETMTTGEIFALYSLANNCPPIKEGGIAIDDETFDPDSITYEMENFDEAEGYELIEG